MTKQAKKVVCGVCGKEFETQYTGKKYCSLNCREAARIIRKIKFNMKNPSYNAEYMRKYRARKRKEKERKATENGRS